jgi:hypothetical protein
MHCQGTDLTKANTGKTYKASSLATSQRFLHVNNNIYISYVHHNISYHIHERNSDWCIARPEHTQGSARLYIVETPMFEHP